MSPKTYQGAGLQAAKRYTQRLLLLFFGDLCIPLPVEAAVEMLRPFTYSICIVLCPRRHARDMRALQQQVINRTAAAARQGQSLSVAP